MRYLPGSLLLVLGFILGLTGAHYDGSPYGNVFYIASVTCASIGIIALLVASPEPGSNK